MALGNVISLGLGSPRSVEHFVTLGLEARQDVLLTGGDSGYVTAPSAATPSLEVGPSSVGAPTYTYGL